MQDRTLYASPVTPEDRRRLLFSAFDTLTPGESVILVADQPPGAFLEDLQTARRGLFEWSPLLEDRQGWHVEITRRNARPGSLRTVTEAMAWDHQRLVALELRAFAAFIRPDRDKARFLYSALRQGSLRHMRVEEDLLFPVFEMKAGLPYCGPTALLRAEHTELRRLLAELLEAASERSDSIHDLRLEFHTRIRDHDRKEEWILYPGIDRLLTAVECDALVANVQSFRW
jgi:uncharacterized protein (DUF2249 family)